MPPELAGAYMAVSTARVMSTNPNAASLDNPVETINFLLQRVASALVVKGTTAKTPKGKGTKAGKKRKIQH
jgi:hypothetical protein